MCVLTLYGYIAMWMIVPIRGPFIHDMHNKISNVSIDQKLWGIEQIESWFLLYGQVWGENFILVQRM